MSVVLDRRDTVLFFSAMSSDVLDSVSLASFSKFASVRGRTDSSTGCESFRRRLSEGSSSEDPSSESRLRFCPLRCSGSVGSLEAVEGRWTGLGGMELRADGLVERSARNGRFFRGGAGFPSVCSTSDCFSKRYQRGRLWDEDGEGKGKGTFCERLPGRECLSGRHGEWERTMKQ